MAEVDMEADRDDEIAMIAELESVLMAEIERSDEAAG